MKQGEVDALVKLASMEITPPQGGNSLFGEPACTHLSTPDRDRGMLLECLRINASSLTGLSMGGF